MFTSSKSVIILSALSLTFVITACSGGGDSNDGDCPDSDQSICATSADINSLELNIETLDSAEEAAEQSSGSSGSSGSSSGEGSSEDEGSSEGDSDDEVVDASPNPVDGEVDAGIVEDILNPDNCSEAELGLISQFAQDESGEIGTRLILGSIQMEVPNQLNSGSLDYSDIQLLPASYSSINAIACDGSVLDEDALNSSGNFALRIPVNIDVTLRMVASSADIFYGQFYGDSGLEFTVVDNTNSGEVYIHDFIPDGYADATVEASTEVTTGIAYTIPLGWDGSVYNSNQRVSAPFAILRNAYLSYFGINAFAGNVTTGFGRRSEGVDYGTLNLAWSASNTTTSGDLTSGEIGSSFYDIEADTIYLLGEEGVNTDEFDADVISDFVLQFLVSKRARLDYVAGEFDLDGIYDPRAAFAEGFPKGFAAALNGTGFYRDSRGEQVTTPDSYSIDLEPNGVSSSPGWYNPDSVARITLDLLDSPALDDDGYSMLGFELIDAIIEAKYSSSFIQLASFSNALKRTIFDDTTGDTSDGDDSSVITGGAITSIDAILASESIASINSVDDVLDDADEEDAISTTDELNKYTWGGAPGLQNEQSANLSGAYGQELTNDAGIDAGLQSAILPIVEHMGVFGSFFVPENGFTGDKVTVIDVVNRQFDSSFCVTDEFGTGGALGNYKTFGFTVFNKAEFEVSKDRLDSQPDLYFQLNWVSGNEETVKPSIRILRNEDGELSEAFFTDGSIRKNIQIALPLTPGAYMLLITTAGNLGAEGQPSGDVCFTLTVDDHFYSELN